MEIVPFKSGRALGQGECGGSRGTEELHVIHVICVVPNSLSIALPAWSGERDRSGALHVLVRHRPPSLPSTSSPQVLGPSSPARDALETALSSLSEIDDRPLSVRACVSCLLLCLP